MANEFLDLTRAAASGGPSFVTTVEPAAGGSGIQAALDEAFAAGGGIVQLLAGEYLVPVNLVGDQDMNNVWLRGVGPATRLVHTGAYTLPLIRFQSREIRPLLAIGALASGATSITYTIAGHAAFVLAGDYIYLTGSVVLGGTDSEFLVAAADGDGGTGIVTLVGAVAKAYTTPSVWVFRNGYNNRITDMSFSYSPPAPSATVAAIEMRQTTYSSVERITIDASFANALASSAALIGFSGPGFFNTCEDVLIERIVSKGVTMTSQISFEIKNISVLRADPLESATGAIAVSSSTDGFVKGCTVLQCSRIGIDCATVGGQTTRRIRIETCDIKNCAEQGINLTACSDSRAESNSIENCATGIECFPGERVDYHGNVVRGGTGTQLRFRTVLNGTMVNNRLVTPNAGANALVLDADCATCVVANNNLISCPASGIFLLDSRYNTVQGNTIDGCTGGAAIRVINDADSNLVQGNSVINSTVPGILVGDDCDNNIVVYNNVNGAGITAGAGTGNDFTGNKV